jgi:hypothetical protein
MNLSRASAVRAALAAATFLPTAALAASGDDFRSDVTPNGGHPWTTPPDAAGRPLGFTLIGDNTAYARPGVFDQAMTQVSWLRPDFALSVGDVIEGYSDDRALIEKQWNDAERSIAKLNCPFVYCVGNHDLNNPATVDAWLARRGPTYYSFTFKRALFLILNTEDPPIALDAGTIPAYYSMVQIMNADPDRAMREMNSFVATPEIAHAIGLTNPVKISDKQVNWVRDTLARNPKPQWTFLVMHKPAWKSQDPQFAKIQEMLASRPHTVIGGHTHYFTHEIVDGHDYINMATCGGIRARPGPGNIDHVINVTLTPNGPLYANIRLVGLMDVAGETGQVRAYPISLREGAAEA